MTAHLPDHVHSAGCGCYTPTAVTPTAEQAQQGPQVVHIHQAPPDRTVQRLALGAGVGGGAVAAAVVLGPMLTAALASVAITLAVTAVVVATGAWAVVTIVRSLGGPDAQQATKTLTAIRKKDRS